MDEMTDFCVHFGSDGKNVVVHRDAVLDKSGLFIPIPKSKADLVANVKASDLALIEGEICLDLDKESAPLPVQKTLDVFTVLKYLATATIGFGLGSYFF